MTNLLKDNGFHLPALLSKYNSKVEQGDELYANSKLQSTKKIRKYFVQLFTKEPRAEELLFHNILTRQETALILLKTILLDKNKELSDIEEQKLARETAQTAPQSVEVFQSSIEELHKELDLITSQIKIIQTKQSTLLEELRKIKQSEDLSVDDKQKWIDFLVTLCHGIHVDDYPLGEDSHKETHDRFFGVLHAK